MTTVAIHQPEYFPWLGFVDKARRADVFVLLDTVQFDRSSLQHRAKVAGANGRVWLTIPFVHRFPQQLDAVDVASPRWGVKHWKTLQSCYGRAPGWEQAAPQLSELFEATAKRLLEITVPSVHILLRAFGVDSKVLLASKLDGLGDKGNLVRSICGKLGATRYLSGKTGASYLDSREFEEAGIEIVVQDFCVPTYKQHRAGTEVPGLSALDAWLSLGSDAATLLEGD